MRSLYFVGYTYVAVSAFALLKPSPQLPLNTHAGGTPTVAPFPGPAGVWFSGIKQYCNTLEVETALRSRPAPMTLEGAGYSAACLALAGKIDQARDIVLQLPSDEQWRAAGIVFNVGHPVADAGDDRSAGPIMELVVEFWPNHYMALYHAGMAAYALDRPAVAQTRLQEFLKHYEIEDFFRSNAIAVLKRLEEE